MEPLQTLDTEPLNQPQSLPRIGNGHPEYHFVQSIMELQKSVVEINTNLTHLKTSVDGIKGKVDDLVRWKTLIIGGAITIGFLLGLAFAIGKYVGPFTQKVRKAPSFRWGI